MNVEKPRAAPPLPLRIDRKDMPNTIVMRDAKGVAVFGMMFPGSSEIRAINYVEAACNLHHQMLEALKATRALVDEAAMTGFNWQEGDWVERLFANQAKLSAAIAAAEAEAR